MSLKDKKSIKIFYHKYLEKAKSLYPAEYEWFYWPVSKDTFPDYYDKVSIPMYFEAIKKSVDSVRYDYGAIELFIEDFLQIGVNARIYNDPTAEAVTAVAKFERLFYEMLDDEAKKLYDRITEKLKKHIHVPPVTVTSTSESINSINNSNSNNSNNSNIPPERKQAAPSERKQAAVVSAHSSPNILPQSTAEHVDTTRLRSILTKLKKIDIKSIFNDDPRSLPQYSDYVRKPMWFGRLSDLISKGHYESYQQFHDDCMLIWQNCRTYNGPASSFSATADRYEDKFKSFWQQEFPKSLAKPNANSNNSNNVFKPPVPPAKIPKLSPSPKNIPAQSNVVIKQVPPLSLSGSKDTVRKVPSVPTGTNSAHNTPKQSAQPSPPLPPPIINSTLTSLTPKELKPTSSISEKSGISNVVSSQASELTKTETTTTIPKDTEDVVMKTEESAPSNRSPIHTSADIVMTTTESEIPLTSVSSLSSSSNDIKMTEPLQVHELPGLERQTNNDRNLILVVNDNITPSPPHSTSDSPSNRPLVNSNVPNTNEQFLSPLNKPRSSFKSPSSTNSSPTQKGQSGNHFFNNNVITEIPPSLTEFEVMVELPSKLDQAISEKLDVPGLIMIVNTVLDADSDRWFHKVNEITVGGKEVYAKMTEMLPKLMDLETVKRNIALPEQTKYVTYRHFYEDMEIIWANCEIFWRKAHPEYCDKALRLRDIARSLLLQHIKSIEPQKAIENASLHGYQLIQAQTLLKELQTQPYFGKSFTTPIKEAFAEGFEDYCKSIANPIDLTAIEKKLNRGGYHNLEEFFDDCRLVYKNCIQFWTVESEYSIGAIFMLNELELRIKEIYFDLNSMILNPNRSISISSKSKDKKTANRQAARSALKMSAMARQLSTSTFLPPSTPMATPFQSNNATSNSLFNFPAIDNSSIPPPGSLQHQTSLGGSYNSLSLDNSIPQPSYMTRGESVFSMGPLLSPEEFEKFDSILGHFTGKITKFKDFVEPIILLNFEPELLEYYHYVSTPMDFTTISRKLYINEYPTPEAVLADVRLIWENCINFYSKSKFPQSIKELWFSKANELKEAFESQYKNYKPKIRNKDDKDIQKSTPSKSKPTVNTNTSNNTPFIPSNAITPSHNPKEKLKFSISLKATGGNENNLSSTEDNLKKEREETPEERAARKAKKKEKKEKKRREQDAQIDIDDGVKRTAVSTTTSSNSNFIHPPPAPKPVISKPKTVTQIGPNAIKVSGPVHRVRVVMKKDLNPLAALARNHEIIPVKEVKLTSNEVREMVAKTFKQSNKTTVKLETGIKLESDAAIQEEHKSIADTVVKMEDIPATSSTVTSQWNNIHLDTVAARPTKRFKAPIKFTSKPKAVVQSLSSSLISTTPVSSFSMMDTSSEEKVSSSVSPNSAPDKASPSIEPSNFAAIIANASYLVYSSIPQQIPVSLNQGYSIGAYLSREFSIDPSGSFLFRVVHNSILEANRNFPYHVDHFTVSVAVNPNEIHSQISLPIELNIGISNTVGLGVNLTPIHNKYLSAVTARLETGFSAMNVDIQGDETAMEAQFKKDLASLDTVLLTYPRHNPDLSLIPPMASIDWDRFSQFKQLLLDNTFNFEFQPYFVAISNIDNLQYDTAGFYYAVELESSLSNLPCIHIHFYSICGTMQFNINRYSYFSSDYHPAHLLVNQVEYEETKSSIQRGFMEAEEIVKQQKLASVYQYFQNLTKQMDQMELKKQGEVKHKESEEQNKSKEEQDKKMRVDTTQANEDSNKSNNSTGSVESSPRESRSGLKRKASLPPVSTALANAESNSPPPPSQLERATSVSTPNTRARRASTKK